MSPEGCEHEVKRGTTLNAVKVDRDCAVEVRVGDDSDFDVVHQWQAKGRAWRSIRVCGLGLVVEKTTKIITSVPARVEVV